MAKKTTTEMPSGYRFLQDLLPDLNYVIDKRRSAKAYYSYFLNRVLEMFEYKNLPDTIPHEILDKYLMINGIACITKDPDSQLRVFYGNLGGKQDCYYRPTEFIIANPHFKETFSKNCIVLGDEPHDGVLIRNDHCWQGLHAMLSRYSCLLAENTLTLRVSDVLLRITTMLSAPTDKEKVSAEEFLRSIENGELGVIAENAFFDGVKMQNPPSNNGSYLTQFIEYQQYLKGSFYNEVGLSANYNMKREAIGKGESTLDQDALLPLCENMLKARREDLTKVNEMYGTDISVDFSSAWKENMLQAKLILLQQSKEAGLAPEESVSQLRSGNDDKSGDEMGQEERGSDEDETWRVSEDETVDSGDSAEDSSKIEDIRDGETGEDSAAGKNEEENTADGSKINDISRDESLENLDKTLDDALSQLTADKKDPVDENMNLNAEGGDINESGGMGEETTDSKEDISGS